MCKFRSWFVVGLFLMPLALVTAQEKEKGQRRNRDDRDQPRRTEGRTDSRASTDTRSSNQLDKYFVSCLRSDNKGEVTIATLASQKASNPEVKAFAQEMVKDHTDFLAKLDRFDQANPGSRDATTRTESRTEASRVSNQKDATDRDNPPRDNPRKEEPNRDARPRTEGAENAATPPNPRADARANVNRDTATRTTIEGGSGIADQLMQIKQEISEKCVASAQRELNSKEGAEFDRCFVGMQIGGHMHMVDTLGVLEGHVSPELKQIIDQGLQTSQQHLEHAKQLAKKLEGSHESTGDRATKKRSDNKSDNKSDDNTEKAK